MGALLGVGALTRGERRIGWGAVASGVIGMAAGVGATQASAQHLDDAVQLVDARVRLSLADHGARLRRDRRHVLGAKRRREHRARGDDVDGRILRRLGSRPHRLVVAWASSSACWRVDCLRSCTASSASTFAPTRSSSARRSSSSPTASRAFSTTTSTATRGRPETCPGSRMSTSTGWEASLRPPSVASSRSRSAS